MAARATLPLNAALCRMRVLFIVSLLLLLGAGALYATLAAGPNLGSSSFCGRVRREEAGYVVVSSGKGRWHRLVIGPARSEAKPVRSTAPLVSPPTSALQS